MFFARVAGVVAVVGLLISAFMFAVGILAAFNPDFVHTYPTGKLIDNGILGIVISLALGTLAEIALELKERLPPKV